MVRVLLCCLLLCASARSAAAATNRPVIGVLAQPAGAEFGPPGTLYLVASYVSWLEGAGARVAPILATNWSTAQLRDAFEQVNGLLLPGGHCGAHGTPYGDASWQLMQWAKEANDQGDAFPIWGTCQGHEQLAQFGSGAMAPSVLQHTAGTEGWITPVNLTAAGRESSRLLGGAPADVVAALSEQASTIHLHQLSAMASTIEREGSATHAFFKVVATNRDPVHGAEFTSILEARDYPFYSSQFHPEKNAGEWSQGWEDNDTGGEAHSAAAVHAMAYLAEFFVGEARKSPHRWSGDRPGISTPPGTPSAQLPLIYDFTPLRTVGAAWTNQYELTYVWRP